MSLRHIFLGLIFLIFGCQSVKKAEVERPVRKVANIISNQACQKQEKTINEDGAEVIICQQLHSERPYLRLPETKIKSHSIVAYGILEEPDDSEKPIQFRTTGRLFKLVDKKGIPLKKLPNLKKQNQRTNFTIYEISGSASPAQANQLVLRTIKPSLMVNSCAMEGLFAGVWEGMVPSRIPGTMTYGAPFHPIRITLNRMEEGRAFEDTAKAWHSVQGPEDFPLKDGRIAEMIGTLDNFNQEVNEDGVVYPSLALLGDQNPFPNATSNEIRLYRLPSMHSVGSLNLVMQWPATKGISPLGMQNGPVVMTLRNLIQDKEDPTISAATLYPHGITPGFKITDLRLIKPGDGSIRCPIK